MITVAVDDLFVSWLTSSLPGVTVRSERPADLETVLPVVVVRRGAGGGIEQGLDGPTVYTDFYAASRTAVADLARQVQWLFEEHTPVRWRDASLSWLRCIEGALKVPDANPAVHHMASTNNFSLQ